MTNRLKWEKNMDITFESIIGKYILVGITYLDKEGNIIKMVQFDGDILEANENSSIIIKKRNSEELFELPPDLSFIKIADPGDYKLKSTGEIIINPDLITTLIIE
jgi:hypothetical protein